MTGKIVIQASTVGWCAFIRSLSISVGAQLSLENVINMSLEFYLYTNQHSYWCPHTCSGDSYSNRCTPKWQDRLVQEHLLHLYTFKHTIKDVIRVGITQHQKICRIQNLKICRNISHSSWFKVKGDWRVWKWKESKLANAKEICHDKLIRV
jgi:hypothetical protein